MGFLSVFSQQSMQIHGQDQNSALTAMIMTPPLESPMACKRKRRSRHGGNEPSAFFVGYESYSIWILMDFNGL